MNGKQIRENRIKSGLSQEALAKIIGVSVRTVSRWETGIMLPIDAHVVDLRNVFKNENKRD